MGSGPIEGVREATSHPQALGQCRHWLRERGHRAGRLPRYRGCGGAGRREGRSHARRAGPPMAAPIYGLDILCDRHCATPINNTTRFLVLARAGHAPIGDGPFMTTLIFEVKNVPAALQGDGRFSRPTAST